MKWNIKAEDCEGKVWQQSRRGTSRVRELYFVNKQGKSWIVGYKGFGRLVEMSSAGTFKTAREARAYCEMIDNNALIIEEVRA